MNDPTTASIAAMVAKDAFNACNRNYAEICKGIHDQFIRAGFSPDHAMELTHRRLDLVDHVIQGGDLDD